MTTKPKKNTQSQDQKRKLGNQQHHGAGVKQTAPEANREGVDSRDRTPPKRR